MVGRKIGPYAIVDELGAGGMAVVYKAEQATLQRSVAIKELRSEFVKDNAVSVRFEREAHSIASLAHQNIVHVYDFITRAASMYIVMEYVDGIDLYDLLNKVERLPPDIAAIIALQAARALEHAHYRGVVHRDFKPSNLMITKQGDVKLMDFGIARDQAHDDLTLPGQALGTPSYMSPEQIMGKRVNFSSDIFSFGIVLYQMLTGKKPFPDDQDIGVMQRILNQPYKRPRALYPDIPRKMQRIIKKCLRKDPERRYSSTESLRRDLERYVAKKVRINYSGRLLIYLHHKELISDQEARTYVREEDLRDTVEVDSGKVSGWEAVLRPSLVLNAALLLLLAVGVAGIHYTDLGVGSGLLHVNARPWAQVYVDGALHDTTPFAAPIALTPGAHSIEFRNQNFETTVREVTIKVGESQRVSVELQKRQR